MSQPLGVESVHDELRRAQRAMHAYVDQSSAAQLRQRSDGTRWTNQQLLFHMLLGYFVVRSLLPLVRFMARMPDGVSRAFAATLNLVAGPFHVVNYLGACLGGAVLRGRGLTVMCDRTVAALHRRLDSETEGTLGSRMHFPMAWDPYFAERMSVLEVYHYGTQHFDHHLRQLTLPPVSA